MILPGRFLARKAGLPPDTLDNGRILHYDAGNTSCYPGTGTTVTDLSASGNNGVMGESNPIAPLVWVSDGAKSYWDFSYPADHNGSERHINVNSLTPLTDGQDLEEITFSVWVKLDQVTGSEDRDQFIFCRGGTAQEANGFGLDWDSTNLTLDMYFHYTNNGWNLNPNVVPSAGVWFLATCALANQEQRIYINDTLQDTLTLVRSGLASLTTLAIGNDPGSSRTTRTIMGQIHAAHIWNRAITGAEVTDLYNIYADRFA